MVALPFLVLATEEEDDDGLLLLVLVVLLPLLVPSGPGMIGAGNTLPPCKVKFPVVVKGDNVRRGRKAQVKSTVCLTLLWTCRWMLSSPTLLHRIRPEKTK